MFTLSVPDPGAVQRYQMEALPLEAPWLGSSASRLAPTVEPVTDPLAPVISWAALNMSFATDGGAGADPDSVQFSTVAPFQPP